MINSPIRPNKMEAIHELLKAFIPLKYNSTKGQECVKWAEERLLYNEEEDDKDVILLAGATEEEEIKKLSLKLLEKYLDKRFLEEEYCAGKFLVRLYQWYKCGSVSIQRLDSIVSVLYVDLNYPDWLTMLSRNCEYAIDVEEFRKPFEDEFLYIYEIWKDAVSLDEFKSKYDRQVSNSHDAHGRPLKGEELIKFILDPFHNRGLAYEGKGQYDEAISVYSKALEIYPMDAWAYYRRGYTYYFKKEYDKSWDDIKKAQDLGYKIPAEFLSDLRKASGRQK